MIRTRKHNNMILRALEHSIIAQFLSIMCQDLLRYLGIELESRGKYYTHTLCIGRSG